MRTRNTILFKETQYMKGAWVWLLAFAISAVLLVYLIMTYDINGDNKISINGLIIMAVLLGIMFFGLFLLFKFMHIKTIIKLDAIEYTYPPFINKARKVNYEEIVNYEVKKYSPLKDSNGYGITKGSKNHQNEIYNTSGNIGLFLSLKSGKSIMLGTQRKQAIISAMKKMMQEE